eukprot:scaffold6877_cov135-Skeletonema_menzelii.AAC.10
MANDKWTEATMSLNDQFWMQAKPERRKNFRNTHAILEAQCAARLICAWLESNNTAALNMRYGKNERNT